jgi:branched-chain amino acid transport system substrate-binding protein
MTRYLARFVATFLIAATPAVSHAAQMDIPVVLPLTGGAAFLGQGEKTALQIAQTVINAQGGVRGTPVNFVFNDDQSSPQIAVQLAGQIKAKNPPVILGSAIVAMCNAMTPVLADGPVMYCFSPGIHPPAGSKVFTAFISTHDLARALVRYYRGRGFTKLAMITSSDASGQDGRLGFEEAMRLPENVGLQMVASVQFNPTDVSVAAQVQKIKSANPEAVIAWTTGSPFGTVLKGIVQSGLDVPIGTTDANMTYAQMQQYAAFLPTEMLYMSSLWPPHTDAFKLDPKVDAVQKTMFAAFEAAKIQPDISAALAWDGAMLAIEALRSAGPDATPEQIRAYIANVSGWPGINGMYDFKKEPQRGLDITDSVVTRWDVSGKRWMIVSKVAGEPF